MFEDMKQMRISAPMMALLQPISDAMVANVRRKSLEDGSMVPFQAQPSAIEKSQKLRCWHVYQKRNQYGQSEWCLDWVKKRSDGKTYCTACGAVINDDFDYESVKKKLIAADEVIQANAMLGPAAGFNAQMCDETIMFKALLERMISYSYIVCTFMNKAVAAGTYDEDLLKSWKTSSEFGSFTGMK